MGVALLRSAIPVAKISWAGKGSCLPVSHKIIQLTPQAFAHEIAVKGYVGEHRRRGHDLALKMRCWLRNSQSPEDHPVPETPSPGGVGSASTNLVDGSGGARCGPASPALLIGCGRVLFIVTSGPTPFVAFVRIFEAGRLGAQRLCNEDDGREGEGERVKI